MMNQLDKDGSPHGPWEGYHENGQLGYRGKFKNGKHHGLWELYHDNGQLDWKGEFKNGRERGLWYEIYYSK